MVASRQTLATGGRGVVELTRMAKKSIYRPVDATLIGTGMPKLIASLLLPLTLAGCKTPPPSSGSLLSSDRSRAISDSLDEHGASVQRFEREARDLSREVE